MSKPVSIPEVIAALRLDLENLSMAIFHLEKLERVRKEREQAEKSLIGGKRRGRPPGRRKPHA